LWFPEDGGSYDSVYIDSSITRELAMIRTVEAVYEHGVLRPLTPVSLAEAQRVKLIIAEPSGGSQRDMAIVERARAEVRALASEPTIEEVRDALASIPGSLSSDVSAERGDY
jgi:predicted DNA-binding antitoxin AbrB/MazE fold protein